MLEQSSGHQWSPTRPCDLRTWRWACVLVVYPLQHFSASMYHYNKSRFLCTMRACCVICLCHVTNGWTTDTSGDFVWLPYLFLEVWWLTISSRNIIVLAELWTVWVDNCHQDVFLLFAGCELCSKTIRQSRLSFTGTKINAITRYYDWREWSYQVFNFKNNTIKLCNETRCGLRTPPRSAQ